MKIFINKSTSAVKDVFGHVLMDKMPYHELFVEQTAESMPKQILDTLHRHTGDQDFLSKHNIFLYQDKLNGGYVFRYKDKSVTGWLKQFLKEALGVVAQYDYIDEYGVSMSSKRNRKVA